MQHGYQQSVLHKLFDCIYRCVFDLNFCTASTQMQITKLYYCFVILSTPLRLHHVMVLTSNMIILNLFCTNYLIACANHNTILYLLLFKLEGLA